MSRPSRPRLDLALQAGHDVVGQLDPLEGLAQHELAGVQDERLVTIDRGDLGQVGLLLARIDERVAMVVEDAELAVEMQVHRGRLQAGGVEGVHADAAFLQGGADVAIGEDAHGVLALP